MTNVFEAAHIVEQIDSKISDAQDDGFRKHLGGSLIGRECSRELWYKFRWATITRFKGRMLRLFQRGHLEEFRFAEYLRSLGIEVRDYSQRLMYHDGSDSYICIDWDEKEHTAWIECDDVSDSAFHIQRATERKQGPEQWRISDVDGHFGGSLDSILYNVPGVERFDLTYEDPVLGEYKTHGQKSFDKLINEGLEKAKPEHVAQMQTYMVKRGIKLGLYLAVNKNTDEIAAYFVTVNAMAGQAMLSKAREIIYTPIPPKRISTSPSWFKCRFCDEREVCHLGAPMIISCRSCSFSKPVENGEWFCAKWQAIIPDDAIVTACPSYTAIQGD